MLTVNFGSTVTFDVTLTDLAGDAVTGATVTVTIEERDGTALVEDASMTDQGSGVYRYTIASGLLPTARRKYTAKVTAVSGANTRYAEFTLWAGVDDA